MSRALPNRAEVEALFKELFGSKAVISKDSAHLGKQLLVLKDACVVGNLPTLNLLPTLRSLPPYYK